MKRLFVLCVILFLSSSEAICAQFFVKDKGTGIARIVLEGEIEPGDSAKLISVIKDNPVDFIAFAGMAVNSRGGSVTEAIKIAKIIESSAMTLRVEGNDTCASACFILFVSASYRWANNDASILIHRPYFNLPPMTSPDFSKAIELQQEAMREMREFLQARSVPSSLIDKMMNYPSDNAYRVTIPEIYDQIGSMSPTLEELTIKKCGLSNSNIFRRGDSQKDNDCIALVLTDIRMDYLKRLIGLDNYLAALNKAWPLLRH